MTETLPECGIARHGEPTLAAAVVIGRNEGARLIRCLAAIGDQAWPVVYVDSGSTDGSVAAARAAGAEVVELDLSRPFTAARARNAGLKALGEGGVDYVQFIDGDCELEPGWISAAQAFLDRRPVVAIAAGRLRERHPEASVYNRLCDDEWDTPVGRAKACGGIMLARRAALTEVGGFRDDLIAGEEPELCVRLRGRGWEIWRLADEMALHDAAMTQFTQWWRRARRGGHAYAEGVALHGAPPVRHWVAERRRALVWGAVLPLMILSLVFVTTPWTLALALIYPAQVARLALRENPMSRFSWEKAAFMTLGKIPEALGVLEYTLAQARQRPRRLIEYKH